MTQSRNKDSNSFIKFLAVIDIIIKNSDENHPLTVKDIQNKVYELKYDFSLDQRLIKKYIYDYNEYYNDDIICRFRKGRNDYYYCVHTPLDIMEAKAIVDLVYSSDFFTLKTKENYKKRIENMFSIHYEAYFNKPLNLHVEKNENDRVFYQELEIISRAIDQHHKIRFIYQKPSLISDTKSKEVILAPIDTCFSNNEYYLLCQGAKNPADCLLYRLDYVKDVKIIENSYFEFNEYQLQCFHEKLKNASYMYGEGQLETIELDFDLSIYPNMIDKFGKTIQPHHIHDTIYRIKVKHIINSTFYSWIIGFGGKIQIAYDDPHRQLFENFLLEQFMKN